jgi:DNA invertase Pin-like site-specific DNA recombinase
MTIPENAGRLIGYARVSTKDQDLALQLAALKAAGVAAKDIYTDKASGKLSQRPGLDKALARLEPGDTLVVWKMDRLGRSMIHLVETVTALGERDIGFRSLSETFIDTTTNGGKFIFHVFAALAEFERGLIRERTKAGLDEARAKGHRGGRQHALTGEQVTMARKMHAEGQSVSAIARVLATNRQNIYRALEGSHGYDQVAVK